MTRRAPNRRTVLGGTGALAAAASLPFPALAQAKPRLVVIGGGPGGATLAKYVARNSNGAVEVTLVEPSRQYTTCFHSNFYLGGFRGWDSITQSYEALASRYGITLVHQTAQAIDREKRTVRLADGSRLAYDRLAVAPGIDLKFDSVPGYSDAAAEAMPHAWKSGPQTQLLKRQLDALDDGATVVVVPPPNPYRCPPAPYERISVMAHVLKAKGHRNSRIIVLDPKPTFAMQALFEEGWERHYPGMIEWQDPQIHGGIKRVDPKTMTIETDLASYKASLANIIPAQIAASIARDAGLANAGGYCPIDPAGMQSTHDPNVYIVGDAGITGDMPKAASSANSQAKVAAMAICRELGGAPVAPARYAVTCWSLIAADDAVKVGGHYEPRDGKITAVDTFVSGTAESAEMRRQNQEENVRWYSELVADVFR